MTNNDLDRFIKLEIYTKSSNPNLLRGLDVWLQLGLIKESQVVSLCRNYLICPLPEIKAVEINSEPLIEVGQTETVTLVETAPIATVESQPNIIVQIWRAFLDELSIRWLLFLGIFLVVVSSGVLAATQWQNFPDSGQYLILWGYTLSFCGIGYWLNRQENLQLTSQTLKNIAILLVPINFWAMSSFSFGFNSIEWLIIPIAALSLTGITYLHYRQFSLLTRRWFLLPFLLLGYLHLGWQIPNFSTVSVYFGILAIVVAHQQLFRSETNYQIVNSLFLLITWILLLVRALFIASEINIFSLAIAAAGWLLATIYLARENYLSSIALETDETNLEAVVTNFLSRVLQPIGIIIIVYGWFSSLFSELFWQTTAINLLAINLFDRRLRFYWRKRDLTAIFLIGLQALFVATELIPLSWRIAFMDWATNISNQNYLPESVFSITLFPYLILFLVISAWLYRQGQQKLAIYSGWLSFIFSISLTILASYNPTWRTVNLFFTTITYAYVGYLIKPVNRSIINLTHACLLLTICSSIDLFYPTLSNISWGQILLVLTVGELSLFLQRFARKNSRYLKYWYRTTWYFGLFLATISYSCFLLEIDRVNYRWGWVWLITSVMLSSIAKYNRLQQRQIAANLSNGSLFFLQILTYWQPETRSLGLLVATTLTAINTNYLPSKIPLAYLTHGWGLLTIISTIDWLFSPLSREICGCIFLGLAITEWIIKIIASSKIWQRTYGHYGLLLAALSYLCFLFPSIDPIRGCLWLSIPLMLTVATRYGKGKQKLLAAFGSCVALVLVQILTFSLPETRLISLGMASLLMLVNTRYLRHTAATTLHLGFIIGLIINLLRNYLSDYDWLVFGSIALLSLNIFSYYLIRFSSSNRKVKSKYLQAINYWSLFILSLELIILSKAYFDFAFNDNSSSTISYWQCSIASLLITISIAFRFWQQPSQLTLYIGTWTIELLVTSLITLTGGNGLSIATANIILALLSLWWINYFPNLYFIPAIYTIIGILWRLNYFTNLTGLITLGASLTGLGLSNYRGKENKILRYVSLAGITISIYELVIYEMSQSSGNSATDRMTILALVAASIAMIYRLLIYWATNLGNRQFFFNLTPTEIIITAHCHWAIASIFQLIGGLIAIKTQTTQLIFLSIIVRFSLGIYAIFQARNLIDRTNQDWWIYIGIAEFIGTILYSRLLITELNIFDPWWVIFACIIALIIDRLPWENFGWRMIPWRYSATVIPTLVSLITVETISYFSLLVTAIFYLFITYDRWNFRWSYLSLVFINWAAIKLIWQENIEFIWLAIVISLSILYIAQFDPYVRSHRKQRHYLRLFGSGFTCLIALLLYQKTGIIPSIVSILTVFAGLGLRIRAFLYVGTITFLLTIIYQLIILVFTYSFLKWIVGLIAGIATIIIAANFESQRDSSFDRWQSYLDRLQEWQ
jgi:hypothetical protein